MSSDLLRVFMSTDLNMFAKCVLLPWKCQNKSFVFHDLQFWSIIYLFIYVLILLLLLLLLLLMKIKLINKLKITTLIINIIYKHNYLHLLLLLQCYLIISEYIFFICFKYLFIQYFFNTFILFFVLLRDSICFTILKHT